MFTLKSWFPWHRYGFPGESLACYHLCLCLHILLIVPYDMLLKINAVFTIVSKSVLQEINKSNKSLATADQEFKLGVVLCP